MAELARRIAIEQTELLVQSSMTISRKRAGQVADHRPQTAHDLQVAGPAPSYFTERQVDKIIPVGRPEDHTQTTRRSEHLVGMELSQADCPQHAMQLIDGQDRRGWVVDRRR